MLAEKCWHILGSPHLFCALSAFLASSTPCVPVGGTAACPERPTSNSPAPQQAKVTSPSFVTPGNQSTTTCSRRVPMSAHCRADIRLSHQPVGPVLNALWLFGTH
ncbi:TPA: hypothetical protein ACH3X2_001317 [Trebouxia sp. C0005]